MKSKFGSRVFSSYLDKGERIVHIAHKHVLRLKIDGAKSMFFGLLLPTFLYFLFPQALLIFLIWWSIGFAALIYHFIDWFYDVWLLTNVGVIDIERNGFFDITTTRIEYHMIEGIAYSIKGFWQMLFNYGDITVDKLGSKTSVVLRYAASPKKLERLLNECQEKYVYDRSLRDHIALKDMLSDMIAYHVQNQKINPNKKE